jgi:ATP synthase protein I
MTWRAMSGTGPAPSDRDGSRGGESPDRGQPSATAPVEDNAGWSIFSYLIAGMVAYGLIGWLVAWLTHVPVLLPLGALVGLVFAIGGVVWKYGRY